MPHNRCGLEKFLKLTYVRLVLAHYPNKDNLSNFHAGNWEEKIDHFLEVATLLDGMVAVEETY